MVFHPVWIEKGLIRQIERLLCYLCSERTYVYYKLNVERVEISLGDFKDYEDDLQYVQYLD